MNEKIIKQTAVIMPFLTCIAMLVILIFVSNQDKLLANAGLEVDFSVQTNEYGNDVGEEVHSYMDNQIIGADFFKTDFVEVEFEKLKSKDMQILFKIQGDKAEVDLLKKQYKLIKNVVTKELILSFRPGHEQITLSPGVSENSLVESISYRVLDGEQQWKVTFTDYVQSELVFEDNGMYLNYKSYKDSYENIIVIDPARGGEDFGYQSMISDKLISEKDITLTLAKKILENFSETDANTVCILLREDDFFIDQEKRVFFCNDVGADLYLGLETSFDETSDKTGAYALYSEQYVIPFFGGVEFADIILKNYGEAIKMSPLGLYPEELENQHLSSLTMPSTTLKLGNQSNELQLANLMDDNFINDASNGIVAGILQALELSKKENP
jgi:N-acetylmuramoyl-L-alanine amidase